MLPVNLFLLSEVRKCPLELIWLRFESPSLKLKLSALKMQISTLRRNLIAKSVIARIKKLYFLSLVILGKIAVGNYRR